MDELERIIKDWEFWCVKCRNRDADIVLESQQALADGLEDGDERKLKIRVLRCSRGNCLKPHVLMTYSYWNDEDGVDARGSVPVSVHPASLTVGVRARRSSMPIEHVAMQMPAEYSKLPKKLDKKVEKSIREAEFAVSNNKPVSAAAAIRNAIRLLVESENIEIGNDFASAIKELELDSEYRKALGDLKLVGDHSLHYEEYDISELRNHLKVLLLAVENIYSKRSQLEELRRSVGKKSSQQGKSKNDSKK